MRARRSGAAGIHLGPVSWCRWAKRVNGAHAYRLNGAGLIDRQTDDLNECRERIKCLLSAPFIPLSCPLSLPLSGEGGGACCWSGGSGKPVLLTWGRGHQPAHGWSGTSSHITDINQSVSVFLNSTKPE